MAKRLPIITIDGRQFYHDQRLGEARAVDNPHERIDANDLAEYEYWLDELQHFIDKSITRVDLEFDKDVSSWYPYLVLSDQTRIYLVSDEEGNAGGRFHIQPDCPRCE